MMETLCSSETSVLTTATRRNIPEDGILHCSLFNWGGGSYFNSNAKKHEIPSSKKKFRPQIVHNKRHDFHYEVFFVWTLSAWICANPQDRLCPVLITKPVLASQRGPSGLLILTVALYLDPTCHATGNTSRHKRTASDVCKERMCRSLKLLLHES
jgi:hypothetical protein